MEPTKRNVGDVDAISQRPVNQAYYRKFGTHSKLRANCTVSNSQDTKNSVNTARRRTGRANSQPYVKDTRRLIDDEIEGDAADTSDSENQPGPTKRKLTDDILEIADVLCTSEAFEASGHPPKRARNMLGRNDASLQQFDESDILVPSTPSSADEGENSIPLGFTDIVKLSLSLGTIGQLKKGLEDAETHAEEAELALIEAQLQEIRAKVEKCTTERVLGDVKRLVRQLQADSHHPAMPHTGNSQADAVIDTIFTNFRAELAKASNSKANNEVMSVVLEYGCKELEALRQSVERCEHQVKVSTKDLEKKQQRVSKWRRTVTLRELCPDAE
ncbi:hypothetical protein Forpe1208_v012115 [Fusarium oxysporum f. sp. rapae]|uniref:Uncharacterized protein n=1 Tax=Fusarium oxysporum f. sp. rapae TaxID=485398 RepID=A0A8J5TNW3_FUSOX|nr:hypothetical protein Forpe1208_v016993 [Fusarium oxysporum f. sp. rapae]KAG7408350.1 hypothetical protein Forpe1208_v012115 [Fusarium oxysporum f. sp. rapae]